jgi:hypothetical protein
VKEGTLTIMIDYDLNCINITSYLTVLPEACVTAINNGQRWKAGHENELIGLIQQRRWIYWQM